MGMRLIPSFEDITLPSPLSPQPATPSPRTLDLESAPTPSTPRNCAVNSMQRRNSSLKSWQRFAARYPRMAPVVAEVQMRIAPLVEVINPLSQFAKGWDALILLAMLYTAVVTPFEIAFLARDWPRIPESGSYVNTGPYSMGWSVRTYVPPFHLIGIIWVLNRMCDATFMLDILLQFNIAVYETSEMGATHLQWNRFAIATSYLTGSFWIDVVSSIPYDLITASMKSQSAQALKSLRVLKLLRLGRSLRVISKVEQRMNVSLAYIRLGKYLIMMVFTFHFMACGLAAVFEFEGANCNWVSFSINTKFGSHACDELILQPTASYIYIEAFFWAALRNENQVVMQTKIEKVYCIIACILLAVIQASIIGEFFSIVDVLGFREKKFALAMDELNLFINTKMIPDELAGRLRAYYRLQNRQHVEALTSWTGVLMELPISMRLEVITALGANSRVKTVDYFRHLEGAQALSLALELRSMHFPPGERVLVAGTDMREGSVQILQGGIIELRCFLYGKGRYHLSTMEAPLVGEELFWPGTKLATYDVVSATTTTLLSIEGSALLNLMEGMPGYKIILKEGRTRFMRNRLLRFIASAQRIADFVKAVERIAAQRAKPPRCSLSLADVLLVGGYPIPGHSLAVSIDGSLVNYGTQGVTTMVTLQAALFAAKVAASKIYHRAVDAAKYIQRWYARVRERQRLRANFRYAAWKALALARREAADLHKRFAVSSTSAYISSEWLTAFVHSDEADETSGCDREGEGEVSANEHQWRASSRFGIGQIAAYVLARQPSWTVKPQLRGDRGSNDDGDGRASRARPGAHVDRVSPPVA